MSRRRRIPQYRRHKPSGQAVVRILGHDHYLGAFGSPGSKQRYDELIACWLQGNRPPPSNPPPQAPSALLVKDVCAMYLEHARRTYFKRGALTAQIDRILSAFKPLRELFGNAAAVAFGPKALKQVRERMIAEGLGRTTINTRIGVIKQAWDWTVSEELLPGTCAHALRAVKGLRKGTGIARDRPPVKPVPWPVVEQTLPHLGAALADAVRLQYLTGMRPCEVLALRPCDLDQSGQVPDGPTLPGVWVYNVSPDWNKTAHQGKARIVLLGPSAQQLLAPLLMDLNLEDYVFSPARVRAAQDAERSVRRKTRRYPSHMRRNKAKRKARPKRKPGAKYETRAYAHAISRAAAVAGAQHWHPNQLRHARATELRRVAGLDRAGTILGHSQLETSQIYAEKDLEAAAELIRRVG